MYRVLSIPLLIVYFFSANLFSQNLDETFLNSLPGDIKEDVLSKINEEKLAEDPVYRNIDTSTEIEKNDLILLKAQIENNLKLIEKKLNEKDTKLDVYCSNFFRTYQSTFMPITEPNLNTSYILDFGDILEVQFIGQSNSIEKYMIARDGSIRLPDIGKIFISGLPLNEASKIIKLKTQSIYTGTEAFITLDSLRDINVLISGAAYNPGVYTLNGNSDILHAIGVAGGISNLGSYRKISLIRKNKTIETLDIYDLLVNGKYFPKNRLRSGDIIHVDNANIIVTMDGGVRRPSKYELLENESLSEALRFANGTSSYADLKNIYLHRLVDNKVQSFQISNLDQLKDIGAQDGDRLSIRKNVFRSIEVKGAVLNPGTYLISDNESFDDLVKKFGGYTENAYLFGAIYENEDAQKINEIAKEKLYIDFIENIVTISQKNPINTNTNSIIGLVEKLKNTTPNGRIAVVILNETKNSIVIKDGDKLTVPEKTNHIYIYGEIANEGALMYVPSEDINYYIANSGGLKETADSKLIYILQPNGDTQSVNINKNIFASSARSLKLYPGSVIYVPREIDDSSSRRIVTQAYVSMLGNLGIALASLASINDN